MFSLLTCPNCPTTNTFKLPVIEEEKKGLARFMQNKCRDCEFTSIYTSRQIHSTKDNCSRGMKTML